MPRVPARVCLTLVGLVAVGPALHASAVTAAPAIEFSDSAPLALTTGNLNAVRVLVVNDTGLNLSISAFVEFAESSDQPIHVVDASNSAPLPMSLPAHGVARLGFSLNGSASIPTSAPWSGVLSVHASPIGVVINRQVTFAAPSTAAGVVAKPLQDSWSIRGWLMWPWSRRASLRDPLLPLAVGVEPGKHGQDLDLPKDAPLGTVTRGDGRILSVSWDPSKTKGVVEHVQGISLTLSGNQGPGTYTGSIDTIPSSDDKGAVALTVTDTVIAVWPILALLAGMLLAWGIQRLTGVWLRLNKLKQREAEVESSVHKADMKYRAAIKAHGFKDVPVMPKIAEKLKAMAQDARKQLNEVSKSFVFVLDEQDDTYKKALANLQMASDQADALAVFGEELGQLDEVLTNAARAAKEDDHRPPPVGGVEPLAQPIFITSARQLFRQDKVEPKDMGADTFPELRGKVKAATTLAESWPSLYGRIKALRDLFEIEKSASDLSPSDAALVAATVDLMSQLEWNLWYAMDADDLAARGVKAQLETLEQGVAALTHLLPTNTRATVFERGVMGFRMLYASEEVAAWAGAAASLPWLREPEEPRARAKWLATERSLVNRVIFVLLLLAAIWTGLSTLYIGRAWGTWTDWIAALLWGLGTKVGLDTVASALETLRQSRLPASTAT